jgi:hypothetical protein
MIAEPLSVQLGHNGDVLQLVLMVHLTPLDLFLAISHLALVHSMSNICSPKWYIEALESFDNRRPYGKCPFGDFPS